MEKSNMEKLAQRIVELGPAQINEVLQLLVKQWESAFPGYGLLVTAVPKNDVEEQKRILEFAFRMIDESNH